MRFLWVCTGNDDGDDVGDGLEDDWDWKDGCDSSDDDNGDFLLEDLELSPFAFSSEVESSFSWFISLIVVTVFKKWLHRKERISLKMPLWMPLSVICYLFLLCVVFDG